MKFPFTLFLQSLLALSPVIASERPNVLLIVCDDLNTHASTSGYSPGAPNVYSESLRNKLGLTE